MVSLIFKMKLKEGKEEEGLAQIEKMVAGVEANEPGVLAYVFHRAVDDPSTLVLYESYKDDDAFASHMKTPHMAEFQASVAEFFDTSAIEVTRLDRLAGVLRG